MPTLPVLDADLVERACGTIRSAIRRTPTEPSPALSERLGVPVLLKLECLQVTGSFKVRGALFRLSELGPEERRAGVATCSAGNHGLAVAWAAERLGLAVEVYVPARVDAAKYHAMLELRAEVLVGRSPGYDETEAWALERARAAGRTWVSAYDDPWIMAGNGGSLAVETLGQTNAALGFVVPTGGGGLAAGFSVVLAERRPDARLLCCQHEGSPGLALSLERGEAVTELPAIRTVAGGIEGGLGAGCYEVLARNPPRVALASEEEILEGVAWMLEHHRYLIEPSSAVVVAACLSGRAPVRELSPRGEPVVLVLSGRNVARPVVEKILRRAGGSSRS